MTQLSEKVLKFSSDPRLQEVYIAFDDYYNHYQSMNKRSNPYWPQAKRERNLEYHKVDSNGVSISFSEKEERMNQLLRREILRTAGVQGLGDFDLAVWASNPLVQWATFAIVGALVDMVLPDTVIDEIGLYTEIRNIGWGDTAAFDIEPRDLFAVSRHGMGQRSTEIHKQYTGQVTVNPVNRQLTTGVDLYNVLAGKDSLAKYVTKVIRSFEFEISLDAYTSFLTLMEALDSTASTGLRVSGYTQDELTRLGETVESWNGGQQAVIFGTRRALVNVLPTDANYRYDLDSDFMKMGYVGEAFGFSVMKLAQKADWRTNFSTLIDNDNLYLISPGADKLVKLVFEGSTLSNTTSMWENADLSQTSTMMKKFATGIATSAVAGIIQL